MTEALDVVIVGAGGFGRELLQYSEDARSAGWPHRIVGFLDDRADALDDFAMPMGVVGGFNDVAATGAGAFVIAVGDAGLRRRVAEAVADAGGVLVSVAHPTAYVAKSAVIGPGTVLCPFTVVAAHSVVGSNVSVNVYASIGHDARVGEHCVISPYAAITGAVDLGAESFLGTHSTIAPGTTIGRRSKVSAGAVVSRDAAAGSLLVGNPAMGRVMYSLG